MKDQKDNIFMNVFGRIWAAWGLLSFVMTFLIIFPFSMCSWLFKDYRKGQIFFLAVSRIWMRFWLFIVGCPVSVYGRKNFKPGENYVVTYNHNTFLDVPLSAPFVPEANKTIAKKEFSKVPIFGAFYRRGGLMIDRSSEQSRRNSFEAMSKVLRMRMHMCIYPEGTRNKTTEPLRPFYDGAFKLAIANEKDIIPCVMTGTAHAMPHYKKYFLRPTRLAMYFLPPIPSANKTAQELNAEVREAMLQCYQEKERFARQ